MLTDNLTFSLIELIGMAVLAVGMLIQLVYLISLTSLIFRKKPGASSTGKPSVSIIITARNYAEELRESLPLLLEQNYPDYEVVVVDDCSTDHTDSVLRVMKHKYPQLKTTIVKQETDFANALALTVGIRAATNDWLIFLDPQVVVPGSGWLDAIQLIWNPEKTLCSDTLITRVLPVTEDGGHVLKISPWHFDTVRPGFSDYQCLFRTLTCLSPEIFSGEAWFCCPTGYTFR